MFNSWLLVLTSLKVNKENLFIDTFFLLSYLCESMLFKSLLEINIESGLHCIDIYDEDCIESKSRGNK